MTDAWRRVEARKEEDAKEKARQEAEAKRESMARQIRYIGVLASSSMRDMKLYHPLQKQTESTSTRKNRLPYTMALWHLL